MLGNFSFCNPTKLYFGDDSLNYLNTELPKYGKNVVLIYGGGSIKKNGIYDAVMKILIDNGKDVAEIAGVMPNPTVDKLYEGVEIARKAKADLLLAVGGGSVCDYAKAVSVSVNCGEDPWEKYYIRFEEPSCETLPVGCVLTMVGTGSEMNAGAVITNPHTHQKIGQSVGAYTNATHGMTLAAVSLPYYRYILPYGVQKFKRFAVNVWDIDPAGKTDEQTAREGLDAMEAWMNELGLVMNISDLGATEEMLEGIADGTIILPGGYKVLEHDEIVEILKESMK